jgi:hypothetical protein
MWSMYQANGHDPELSVEDYAYKQGEGVGVIKCATREGRNKVRALMERIGLGPHINQTLKPAIRGSNMSFKKPTSGLQDLEKLLEVIFELNGLSGECGRPTKRVERSEREATCTMVTVFFPESVVDYAEAHEWCFRGMNGCIHLQGFEIRDRKSRSYAAAMLAEDAANALKAQQHRQEEQEQRARQGGDNSALFAAGAQQQADANSGGKVKWANQVKQAANEDAALMAGNLQATGGPASVAEIPLPPKIHFTDTYLAALVAVLDMVPTWLNAGSPPEDVRRPERHTEAAFATKRHSQKPRFWRRLKEFAALIGKWIDSMEEANKPQPLLAALAAAKEETATLAIAAKAANLADGNVVDAEDQAMDQGKVEEGNAQMALTAAEEQSLLTNEPEDEN